MVKGSGRFATLFWLLAIAVCVVIVTRSSLRTDMGAFLPRANSDAQSALTDQATNGAASHLILLGLTGAPAPVLAALSEGLAARLRQRNEFIDVANGDDASFAGVRDFVWRNRYLLSADVTADRFTVDGLHAALENDLFLLGSDMGGMVQDSLSSDPTGEILSLMGKLQTGGGPRTLAGVWVSADGRQALLLVHSVAAGFDVDGQQQDLATISAAFDAARAAVPEAADTRLVETGPGVFAVRIRNTTKGDVTRLSMLATAGAAGLLLFAYRSPLVLLLGLLPVASGALAAVAAVALRFGFVHGVTLGFGVTLIGESVDYAIYLFTQTAPGERAEDTLVRIWPTLRLGAATSVVGFSAMLFSSFTGFAQLGLFSITGLVAAAGVTRFVLPHLVPHGFFAPGSGVMARPLLAVQARRGWLRALVVVAVLAGGAALLLHQGELWDSNLADLSPVPAADQAADQALRHDMGVPDERYFVVFRANGEQAALEESESLFVILQGLRARGALGSFDMPSSILPSAKVQRQRQAAIPDDVTLRGRFAQAVAGMPFRADAFAPFFPDAARARTGPVLTESSLPPALALRLSSMLMQGNGGWTVTAPLRGVSDPSAIAAAIAAAQPGAQFVDLNQESVALLRIFQRDATRLAVIGSVAILAVLLVGLRSPARVLAVAAPLAAAVIVTAALLTLGGEKLSIFMVVGFLLIVAVGSNYCLFLERRERDAGMRERAAASVVLANSCTVAAYGLMSLSRIPVLHDIGMTVAIGTFLSLYFGAALGHSGAA